MKLILPIILFITVCLTSFSCSLMDKKVENSHPNIVYQTDDLIIKQLSNHTYLHTSYFQSEDFGKVDCNGMIVIDSNEAIIIDTPVDSISTMQLITWVHHNLNHQIVAIIASHFHIDCIGGLKEFHQMNIPSYAQFKTIELTKDKGFNIPQNGFNDSLKLNVGSQKVEAKFMGEGHTKDNIIVFIPSEEMLFGGCLIKELGAGKGNIEDANVEEWSNTIDKIKKTYPSLKLIIPGHGQYGDQALLDYTYQLFKTN